MRLGQRSTKRVSSLGANGFCRADCVLSESAPTPARLAEMLELAPRATAWRGTFNLCLLAELGLGCAEFELAGRALGQIGASERGGLFAPEIERIAGELCLHGEHPDPVAAERHLVRAIEIADERRARSFALRGTTGLVRVLRSQGRCNEARDRLGAIYGAFDEGLDTLDLRRARELMDELRR
jgi:hypothetical protein